ncbi:MAG: NAD(P)/FAD-dependent oxidoreductase [Parvularculaceae bacterium]
MSAAMISRRHALAGAGVFALAAACGGRRMTEGRHDVIVVGAGLSGLYATLLLEELGFDVLVLEASDRLGGRLKTLDHLAGAPECGGQTLGPMYARVLKLASRFGLDVFERKALLPGNAFYLGERLRSAEDLKANPLSALENAEQEMLPSGLYNYYLKQVNPLKDLYDWRGAAALSEDGVSIADRFRSAGASDEAMRLMERWFDGGGMENMSALFACRKYEAARIETKMLRIAGGSSRLPEAMAAGLKTAPRLNTPVAAIAYNENGAMLTASDGSKFAAKQVFFSAPFSVLRGLVLDPTPRQPLADAISMLPYNHITQVKLAFSAPFWERDGLPPAMYADSFVERVTAAPGQDGELHYLNVWIKGLKAAELDQYEEVEIGARVAAEFERIRPAAKGAVSVAHVQSWGRNPYSKGAYHFMGVGDVRRYADVLQKPCGPIRWIGEHAAAYQQGMEGACESAEREVFAILDEIGGKDV